MKTERLLMLVPEKMAGTRVPGAYCAHAAACSECGPQSRANHDDAAFIGRQAGAVQILLEEARAAKDGAKREGSLVIESGLAWGIAHFAQSIQDDTLSS